MPAAIEREEREAGSGRGRGGLGTVWAVRIWAKKEEAFLNNSKKKEAKKTRKCSPKDLSTRLPGERGAGLPFELCSPSAVHVTQMPYIQYCSFTETIIFFSKKVGGSIDPLTP